MSFIFTVENAHVDVRTSKPVENFYKTLFDPKFTTVAERQDRKCSLKDSLQLHFLHLESRREFEED